MGSTPATTDDDNQPRLETLGRLRCVNGQLSLWDGFDAQDLMPCSQRPWADVPRLDREQLQSLHLLLIEGQRALGDPLAS